MNGHMASDLETSSLMLERARAASDSAELAQALLRHANTLLLAGRLGDASASVEEAAALQHLRGATLDEAHCLRLAATLQRLQGRLDEATQSALQALKLAAGEVTGGAAGDAAAQAAAHAELGQIALARADAGAALEAFDAALPANARPVPEWLRGRAKAHAMAGSFESAARDLETAARSHEDAADARAALQATVEAATAWQQAGRFDRAQALVASARVRAAASADREALGGLALLSAADALQRGDAQSARTLVLEAREHALASRAAATYLGAAAALARIEEQRGALADAYAALATGWATVSDLIGADLARASFEPLLRGLRERIGGAAFAASRGAYEVVRRAARKQEDGGL